MLIKISVEVRESEFDYENRFERSATVKVEPGAVALLPWALVCAGLVEATIAEHTAKIAETAEGEV